MADPPCEAAACSKVANCSGLYSDLGILAWGLWPLSLVGTADMFGNNAETAATDVGGWGQLLRTSTILCVTVVGMGWDTGSSPILILLAFSDSFSQALASNCSA